MEKDRIILDSFKESIKLFESIMDSEKLKREIINSCDAIVDAIGKGNKLFVCGNGGSTADAQHLVAELVGRFEKERKGFPAYDLVSSAPSVTAIANDLGYEYVFSRQLEALGNKGDILFGISTSGNSSNLVKAFQYAQKHGIKTIALLGNDGGFLGEMSDCAIIVPHNVTARIQEAHAVIIHIICNIVENELTNYYGQE